MAVEIIDGTHSYLKPCLVRFTPPEVKLEDKDKPRMTDDAYFKLKLNQWLDDYFGPKSKREDDAVYDSDGSRAVRIKDMMRIYDQERFKWMSEQLSGFVSTINL